MNPPRFESIDIFGLNGVGKEQLLHPHFEKWHEWIINRYKPPLDKISIFIPCAAIKPYYNSPIHKTFNPIIDRFPTHKIVVSNAGIIPYEFADCYPFNCYDWNPAYETDELKRLYVEVTSRRLNNYLKAHGKAYISCVSYLHPNSDSLKALREACNFESIHLHTVEIEDIALPPTSDCDLVLAHPMNTERLRNLLEVLK